MSQAVEHGNNNNSNSNETDSDNDDLIRLVIRDALGMKIDPFIDIEACSPRNTAGQYLT